MSPREDGEQPAECQRCGEPYVARVWAIGGGLAVVEQHEVCVDPRADLLEFGRQMGIVRDDEGGEGEGS